MVGSEELKSAHPSYTSSLERTSALQLAQFVKLHNSTLSRGTVKRNCLEELNIASSTAKLSRQALTTISLLSLIITSYIICIMCNPLGHVFKALQRLRRYQISFYHFCGAPFKNHASKNMAEYDVPQVVTSIQQRVEKEYNDQNPSSDSLPPFSLQPNPKQGIYNALVDELHGA